MPSAPEPVNLLLVDDRPENLLALEAILGSPEYRLVKARSGPEALAALERDDFALVLLDVAMPGMTGFDVADHMQSHERTRHVPILFLTAVATGLDEIYKAYTVGAVDYLIKPLNIGAVRAKVAVFVDLFRQKRETERQAIVLRENERREHALRIAEMRVASDERYRKLVEGIDHAFAWEADPGAEHLTFVSRRARDILGYQLSDFAEQGFLLDHVHRDDRELTRAILAEAATEMRDRAVTHRLIAADGSTRWFHTAVSCTTSLGNGHPEMHGLSIDVHELKVPELAQGLKEPLQEVVSEAARLREDLAAGRDPVLLAEDAARIERAAETMRRLVGA
jgi:PAS domain S-box-containing protein